ncbi:hypothetical protein Bbelb_105550 [Branchiostoma belcheri]|nr:hypothetical protein Bbelb_105550 [Branchiostoma belcheri]
MGTPLANGYCLATPRGRVKCIRSKNTAAGLHVRALSRGAFALADSQSDLQVGQRTKAVENSCYEHKLLQLAAIQFYKPATEAKFISWVGEKNWTGPPTLETGHNSQSGIAKHAGNLFPRPAHLTMERLTEGFVVGISYSKKSEERRLRVDEDTLHTRTEPRRNKGCSCEQDQTKQCKMSATCVGGK